MRVKICFFTRGFKMAYRFFRCYIITVLVLIGAGALAQQHAPPPPPTVQDCAGAIPVCQPVYTTTTSYTGHGNVYPEIRSNGVCPLCMDGEKNDVFYIITVQTGGLLKFKLTPNNPANDYDWELFNMTNADCADLYTLASQLTVSCNSYGVTGTNGPTGINTTLSNNQNCNGPGNTNGPAFNKDLPVHAGETFLLNVSNWSSTQQSGYTLDFSESTAQIYDNIPPVIDSIQQPISCSGASQLYFKFSENVKCNEVYQHPEKFTITGGTGGTYTVVSVTSVACSLGATQSPTYYLGVNPKMYGGSYNLNIVGVIHDLCDNAAVNQGYPFTLVEVNAPVANAGPDATIPYGTPVTLHGVATGGTGAKTFHWEPVALLSNPDVQNPVTSVPFPTTVFTVTVTDSIGCHDNDDVQINVTGGPLSVTAAADPNTICIGESAMISALTSGGGTGNYTYSWTSNPPGFTSTIANPVVYPATTTTYSVTVVDGNANASGNVTVNVNQLPFANAGSDISIPYGTNASLHGTAAGGSGNYSYYWISNPPGLSSNLQEPLFINLTATTIFSLTVTDLGTSCISDTSRVIVTVTGGPLNGAPIASPPVICKYASTTLHSMAGGGSGTYTYQWTSSPPGFTSTSADPVVTPSGTTTYNLLLDDGFNQHSSTVTVTVNPTPVIYLGPADTTVCVFDTVNLNAGNPGSFYYWSNGATTQSIKVGTTGIGYDIQNYKVKVTNTFTCSDSAEINVIFSYIACSGISEEMDGQVFIIYPDPTHGIITITGERIGSEIDLQICDLLGRYITGEKIRPGADQTFRKTVDLSGKPGGVYLIKMAGPTFVRVKKIILN